MTLLEYQTFVYNVVLKPVESNIQVLETIWGLVCRGQASILLDRRNSVILYSIILALLSTQI